MKDIDENYSILLFDLLEGNLSEQGKINLLQQIQKDKNLKHEYELLKATFLIKDENILFPHKNVLLKIPKRNNYLILFKKYATVAAACLFIFTGISYYMSRKAISLKNNSNISIKSPEIKLPKIEKLPLTAKRTSANNADFIQYNPTPVNNDKSNTEILAVTTLNKPDSNIISIMPAAPVYKAINTGLMEEITYIINVYPELKTPVSNRKKRSIHYPLLRFGRTMIANLQLPEIKIKIQKSKNIIPKINIQIHTPLNYAAYHEN